MSLRLPPLKLERLVFGETVESAGSLITPADRAKAKAMLLEKLKLAGKPLKDPGAAATDGSASPEGRETTESPARSR